MRSRYRVHEALAPHFVTSTVVNWLPVFTKAERCQIIVDALEYCRVQKGLKVYAWVILDNHFHAILSAPDLPRVMADLKRHTARRLLETLVSEKADGLLHLLRQGKAGHKAESEYQFWQEGYHPQALLGDAMMEQKLAYLHENPVKRGLVGAPEHWRYSSAHEWCAGALPVMRCDAWR